jgi:GNAT superfamily N-acetyltransferase
MDKLGCAMEGDTVTKSRQIDSNFADVCKDFSVLCGSEQKNCGYFQWAKNPFDGWFSRIFQIHIPKTDIKAGIDLLRSEIESGNAPPTLLLTEDKHVEGPADALQSNGFTVFYEQTGMHLKLSELNGETNPLYEIRRLHGPDEFNEWNKAIEQIFKKPKNHFLYSKLLTNDNFAFFACFEGRRVVATTMLYMKERIAGVHFVGTVKDYRKKGIGTLITKIAFQFAKAKGSTVGVLQSSPMGKEMYQKIGFQEYSRITHWEYTLPL